MALYSPTVDDILKPITKALEKLATLIDIRSNEADIITSNIERLSNERTAHEQEVIRAQKMVIKFNKLLEE